MAVDCSIERVLWLEQEILRLREPIKDTYACKKCGRRDGLDCAIPNHLWNEVQDETGCSVLCAWCLDDHLYKKGIKVRALLAFVGKAINASTDPVNDDKHWERHLGDLTSRCSIAVDEAWLFRGLLKRVVESRVEGEEQYQGEAVIVLYEDDWNSIRQALDREEGEAVTESDESMICRSCDRSLEEHPGDGGCDCLVDYQEGDW